jgi:hypothetical protein
LTGLKVGWVLESNVRPRPEGQYPDQFSLTEYVDRIDKEEP